MSILLDALKKSEQQRQLGQTPTLQTSVEGQQPSQLTLNHWFPLSMIALSAVVMVWFGWQQYRDPAPGISPEVSRAVARSAAEGQSGAESVAVESDGQGEAGPASTPPASPTETQDARERLKQSFRNFSAPSEEPVEEPPESKPEVAEEAPSQPFIDPDLLKTRIRKARSEVRSSQGEPERARAKPANTRLEPHVSEPISYWELPQGVRDDLPEIKIMVLVYAEEPEDRFLLTNGQRLSEKDELQQGLVLDEIRRDGAVFLYRKYRFLVKG